MYYLRFEINKQQMKINQCNKRSYAHLKSVFDGIKKADPIESAFIVNYM